MRDAIICKPFLAVGTWRPVWQTDPMSSIRQELTLLHASVCKGLADPKRLLIINALRDGERTVTELVDELGIPQANVSQHLAVLRDKGLVQARKEGQFAYYSVTSTKIIEAMDLLREVMAEQVGTSITT
jgi:DNA-binding transcriptional ArsR family regulator